ncbi:hypothetical protein BDW22DRAFT_1426260 [Trametopsis cervina]|nr:hypothetical protein BDW22DRAFT_1426260 [Trametopsis cervina]
MSETGANINGAEHPSLKELADERKTKRVATRDAKRVAADILKDEGNEHYKAGRYEQAVESYEAAITTYGPRAVYMNNLAAAYLKLEKYYEADHAATVALTRDRKLLKARYRRGLARKALEEYRAAMTDFKRVIAQDPTCQEAHSELEETIILYASFKVDIGDDEDSDQVSEFDNAAWPDSEEPQSASDGETIVMSDSSDYEHGGNEIPCRHYNHQGCKRGKDCLYKHAPDNRSVRDTLGRNVCLYNMLSMCKFAPDKCNYTHDNTYLPYAPRFWDDSNWVYRARNLVKMCGAQYDATIMESLAIFIKPPITADESLPRVHLVREATAIEKMAEHTFAHEMRTVMGHIRKPRGGFPKFNPDIRGRTANTQPGGKGPGSSKQGPSADAKKRGKGKGRGDTGPRNPMAKTQKAKTPRGKNRAGGSVQLSGMGFDDEYDVWEERLDNGGFTNSEVSELACQGVKPWDDGARDVLRALGDF